MYVSGKLTARTIKLRRLEEEEMEERERGTRDAKALPENEELREMGCEEMDFLEEM